MTPRVLIACEFSGVVRRAFRAVGCDVWSCDLLPSEDESEFHHKGNATDLLREQWDLVIAHPPCRYLNHAGVRWLYKGGRRWNRDKDGRIISENPIDPVRWQEMEKAAEFFNSFKRAKAQHVAIENSEMHPYGIKRCGKPDQIVQPWMFGHGEVKAICWWLRGLPLLTPTNIVEGREPRVHHASPGDDRWKERSRTLEGVAKAMAEQWTPALVRAAKPKAAGAWLDDNVELITVEKR